MTPLIVRPNSQVLLADYPPGAVFGPRTLHNCEFVWLLEGSAEWDWQRGSSTGRVTLRPGMLALATSGMHDRLHWDPERPSRHAYVHFDVTAADAAEVGHQAWPTVRDLTEVGVLGSLCDYLIELAVSEAPVAITRNTEVLGLLLNIFVDGPAQPANTELDRHLQAVVDHVRDAWQPGPRIVSVAELSDATGLSSGHLHRIFRERYGCGPAHALELIRLARAAVSLQHSNQTLAEVAAATGFSNSYHFSRRFTTTYGVRPGRFRSTPGSSAPDPYGRLRSAGLLPIAHLLAQRD